MSSFIFDSVSHARNAMLLALLALAVWMGGYMRALLTTFPGMLSDHPALMLLLTLGPVFVVLILFMECFLGWLDERSYARENKRLA